MVAFTVTALSLASFAQVDLKPDAVVLTTSPVITRPSLTSSRTLAIYESSAAIRTHLDARIRETWGVSPESTPPIDPSARTYFVHLDWPSPNEVVVGIADAADTLSERTIAAHDLETAKVVVWLNVRSTIERSLVVPSHETPEIGAPAVEPVAAPAAIEAPDAPPVPAAEPAAVVVGEGSPIQIRKPERFSIGVLALGNVDSGSGFSAVPTLQGRMMLHKWLIVGVELTFRHEELTETAGDVYHIPITGFVGARPWDSLPMELGLATTFDPKIVKLPGDGGVSAGFYVGPYVRGRFPFLSFGDSDFAIIGDLGVEFALARNRYAVAGEEITDGVVALRLAAGLEWSWR
jgi:hypothetical protein